MALNLHHFKPIEQVEKCDGAKIFYTFPAAVTGTFAGEIPLFQINRNSVF